MAEYTQGEINDRKIPTIEYHLPFSLDRNERMPKMNAHSEHPKPIATYIKKGANRKSPAGSADGAIRRISEMVPPTMERNQLRGMC
jgi:hypothetical protein